MITAISEKSSENCHVTKLNFGPFASNSWGCLNQYVMHLAVLHAELFGVVGQ